MPESVVTPPPAPKEHPLANILINVLLPILALSYLGKDDDEKFWHLGPHIAMAIAVCLPLAYGIRDLVRTRKLNPFSVLGLGSVLLTGGITIAVWNEDGTIHPKAALLFAIKEAAIPVMLGLSFLVSLKMRTPLVKIFLINPDIFDLPRIDKAVTERSKQGEFKRLIWRSTLAMAGAFAVSATLNFFLAMYFLGAVDVVAPDARELYNDAVARLTGWSFVVIGVPVLIIMIATLFYAIKTLEKITGLTRDDILLAGR